MYSTLYLPQVETISSEAPGGKIIPIDLPKVNKTWGYEITYHNTRQYCLKTLVFDSKKSNQSTSMHFHVEKRETLLVTRGRFMIYYIENKERKAVELSPNEAFTVPRGLPHSITYLDNKDYGIIIEASTLDTPSDSIRID